MSVRGSLIEDLRLSCRESVKRECRPEKPAMRIFQYGTKNYADPYNQRKAVDVEFHDLKYEVTQIAMLPPTIEKKEILHSINGVFKSGELSVIMGPSGAGKSTLLNVLAGYIVKGSSGSVTFNGELRDLHPKFKNLVAYIPQEEEIRLGLTVRESMDIVANLKLGYQVSPEYKNNQIVEILELLGMTQHAETLAENLSGGQKKRLAIALELISNPTVLFLDEPTTGLDSLSCAQCVELLKKLAKEGRTVICTLHQPTALIFEMFDKLYALADGKCIYDGKVSNLIPYLSSKGLQCPQYHNPADFLMEIAIGEFGPLEKILQTYNNPKKIYMDLQKECNNGKKSPPVRDQSECYQCPNGANALMQFALLYKRNLLSTKRNYSLVINRLIAHFSIGCIFGYLYAGCGFGGNTILANYVYLYGTMLLLVYTGKMSVTLSFPLEMKILQREHFNQWYKLIPYLFSVLLLEIPFQILCTATYIATSFYLTGQPPDRLLHFTFFCIIGTLCAQAWGYFFGATTPIKIAVFIGPVLACVFSVFGFCVRYSDTPVYFQWMYHISYFRAAFHGLMYSMYGLDRPYLPCPDLYCHYSEPLKFLNEMEITNVNLWENAYLIIGISGIVHMATYLALWIKLNKR